MTETKKPPDYSSSAENLWNPPEIGAKLKILHDTEEIIAESEAALKEHWAYQQLKENQGLAENLKAQIRDMIDARGSYQDIENGLYGVKYRRMIKSYHVEPLKEHFPKFASLLVEETVNAKALEGQVKCKLLTEEELKEKGVITETPQYAYYVR